METQIVRVDAEIAAANGWRISGSVLQVKGTARYFDFSKTTPSADHREF